MHSREYEELLQEVKALKRRLGNTMVTGGGGSAAPNSAEYVVLANTAALTAERRLVAGTGVSLTDGGANGDVTIAATTGSSQVVQIVHTATAAVNSGTTQIPFDDTIPQNSEGDEYMTLSITPTNAAHRLRIDVLVNGSNSNASQWITAAVFQDSGNDALAAGAQFIVTATATQPVGFSHDMVAGTTSATTFKVRMGGSASGTRTLNGQSAARRLGGVWFSSIIITEYIP
jgi:hypothetical protein